MDQELSYREVFFRLQLAIVSLVLFLDILECNIACDECVSSGADSCTSCKPGYYLNYIDTQKSYGTCLKANNNASSQSLYVTPTRTNDYKAQTQEGTQSKPFQELQDALAKAEEKCAPFTGDCSVTIYLMKNQTTDHYLLRAPWDYYRPTKTSRESQNLQLSIQPYYCA